LETRGAAVLYAGVGAVEAPIHYWWLWDGGHSWPGHGAELPGEPTSYDIDANEEIWAFFAKVAP
jgi:poly(3-hydroxybutyrate) depolymerase